MGGDELMQRRRPPIFYARAEMREVVCPKCDAIPGTPCLGAAGQPRIENHLERWWARYRRSYPVS